MTNFFHVCNIIVKAMLSYPLGPGKCHTPLIKAQRSTIIYYSLTNSTCIPINFPNLKINQICKF